MTCTNTKTINVTLANSAGGNPEVSVPATVILGTDGCYALTFKTIGLSGWTFTPNNAEPYGISITDEAGGSHPSADEFTNWGINTDHDEVNVDDANTGGDDYTYTVTVTDGTTTLTSDPIIRNRG